MRTAVCTTACVPPLNDDAVPISITHRWEWGYIYARRHLHIHQDRDIDRRRNNRNGGTARWRMDLRQNDLIIEGAVVQREFTNGIIFRAVPKRGIRRELNFDHAYQKTDSVMSRSTIVTNSANWGQTNLIRNQSTTISVKQLRNTNLRKYCDHADTHSIIRWGLKMAHITLITVLNIQMHYIKRKT